jgi:hypothetical protein
MHDVDACTKVIDSLVEVYASNGDQDDRSSWVTFLDWQSLIVPSFGYKITPVASYIEYVYKICSF